MKIPSSYLREKIFSLLDGSVSYDDGEGFSGVVPVVSNEGPEGKYGIMIGEYSDANRSNKDNFGSNSTQLIEIIGFDDSVKFTHVDAIGELVANIIHPTIGSNLLSNTDFSIMVVGKPSINYLNEDTGAGQWPKVNRLLLRYFLLTIEN